MKLDKYNIDGNKESIEVLDKLSDPINNLSDALSVVDKIKKYCLYPPTGIWKSKIALVADDMLRSCLHENGETSHTISSNKIYERVLDELVRSKVF